MKTFGFVSMFMRSIWDVFFLGGKNAKTWERKNCCFQLFLCWLFKNASMRWTFFPPCNSLFRCTRLCHQFCTITSLSSFLDSCFVFSWKSIFTSYSGSILQIVRYQIPDTWYPLPDNWCRIIFCISYTYYWLFLFWGCQEVKSPL